MDTPFNILKILPMLITYLRIISGSLKSIGRLVSVIWDFEVDQFLEKVKNDYPSS